MLSVEFLTRSIAWFDKGQDISIFTQFLRAIILMFCSFLQSPIGFFTLELKCVCNVPCNDLYQMCKNVRNSRLNAELLNFHCLQSILDTRDAITFQSGEINVWGQFVEIIEILWFYTMIAFSQLVSLVQRYVLIILINYFIHNVDSNKIPR